MIYFITKAKKTNTIISFINTFGVLLRRTIKIIPFEKMVRLKEFNSGTYILTDYDLLSESQSKLISIIYSELSKFDDKFKLLNHPINSFNRIKLLDNLFKLKINQFRCFSISNIPEDINFPVFIRKGEYHNGIITNLIYNLKELFEKINKAYSEGYSQNEILITEFIDSSDEKKIFRKYSAFIIDNIIIPRHVFFSKNWIVKGADIVNSNFVQEELEYLYNNPHKLFLKEIFILSGIKYGRIDYSIKNNKIIVWEINPNPKIASSSSLKKSKRKLVHKIFVENFIHAINNINQIKTKEKILNPLLKKPKFSQNTIKQIFPFNYLKYYYSNTYFNLKYILLFIFYKFRNTFLKK